jgi:hypothetical protein
MKRQVADGTKKKLQFDLEGIGDFGTRYPYTTDRPRDYNAAVLLSIALVRRPEATD